MFCSNCGKENPDNAKFCASCGTSIADAPRQQYTTPPPQPQYAPPSQAAVQPPSPYTAPPQQMPQSPFQGAPAVAAVSPKTKATAAILAFFLGTLGIHRFYAGKIGTGIVQLILTIIGYATLLFVVGYFLIVAVGLWVLIDFIMILMGKFKDKNGLLITK